MPENVTKRLAITFRVGLPLGHSATFTHDGELWIAYPAAKQKTLFALTDRMAGALGRIQNHLIRWLSNHPEDADRVAMLLRIIADAGRTKDAVIEDKARVRAG